MVNGGELISEVLHTHSVTSVFTLCGGHISPILVGCKKRGMRVVDVRNEASAVFAADAMARMTGIPGVAVVTAGPGVTNTVTAVKNAQMAQSPLIVIGGATATVLKGRGSLQDIDQLALMRPLVKWATSVKHVRNIPSILERAFRIAQSGVPGPVFLEVPVDLLYDETTVREWYIKEAGLDHARSLPAKALKLYLERHLHRQFTGVEDAGSTQPMEPHISPPDKGEIQKAAGYLKKSKRPVLIVGSQAMLKADQSDNLAEAISHLGIPTYLGGAARGLLGQSSDVQFRHRRGEALKAADLVIVTGFPFDFRLNYGKSINRSATVITVNRSSRDLRKNRRPTLALQSDGALFLQALAEETGGMGGPWGTWFETLHQREAEREREIAAQAELPATQFINPLLLCQRIERVMEDDSVIVVDGGDFVASASYILRPRRPLSWLDPGVFGTLGVGAGFALGASQARPDAQRWIIYGDGSAGYSLTEFDTFVRHNIPVIAVVGCDASWAQIAREQTTVLQDDVGTVLRRTDYHLVAEGFGGKGLLLEHPRDIEAVLREAAALARDGHPVLINAQIDATDFRQGSISI